MTELDSRILNDGTGTVVTLYLTDDGPLVEAINVNGSSSCIVPDPSMARDFFNHPFCNENRLDYPTAANRTARMRPLSEVEYALAEALADVEVAA